MLGILYEVPDSSRFIRIYKGKNEKSVFYYKTDNVISMSFTIQVTFPTDII